MIKIASGKFLMGSEGWGEFETPVHQVFISPFLMDETHVTNAEFENFVSKTGYITDAEKAGAAWSFRDGYFKMVSGLNWRSFAEERSNHPVVLVSWNDADAYAKWANKRLPSEIEWEYCARGGFEQYDYPWGNEFIENKCNWNKAAQEIPATTPVKTFEPNPFGLYDMVGNVWQWINDWYEPNAYLGLKSAPAEEKLKVRRGASFNVIQPFRLRCANRGAYEKDSYSINIGFRCAKDL
ncbi:formylglycine-generating enzyme family protein [Pedobacter aquatilis]|uniref:formylglycine-generating enzyme family protein n=1 Tax=Pedobacter aquatilis TaxID=351343 RepID=UPI002930B45F|nr:formylglycine-generating enzyme family protein [Pedobacter aquatilis]